MSLEVRGSLNVAGVERLAADPTTNLFKGRTYWNTTSQVLRIWDTVWMTVGGGTGTTGNVKYQGIADSNLDMSGFTAESTDYGYLLYNTGSDVARTITLPPFASGEFDDIGFRLFSGYFSDITVQTPDASTFRLKDGSSSATITIRGKEFVVVFFDPDLSQWVISDCPDDDVGLLAQRKRITANLDLEAFYVTNRVTNSVSRYDIPSSIVNASAGAGTTLTLFDKDSTDAFVKSKRIAVYNPTAFSMVLSAQAGEVILNDYLGTSNLTHTLAARSYAILTMEPGVGYHIVDSNDPALGISPLALDDLKDVDAASPEDGQALVYDAGSGDWIAGASGDASFKLQGITGQNLTIKSGSLILSNGVELRTNAGNDLTKDLTSLGDGSYYFNIDTTLLPSSTVVDGRTVREVTDAMIVGLSGIPPLQETERYIPLGGATKTGGVWSDLFSTAFRRHDLDSSPDEFTQNPRFEAGSLAGFSKEGDFTTLIASSTDPLQGTHSLTTTNNYSSTRGKVKGRINKPSEGNQKLSATARCMLKIGGTGGTYLYYVEDSGGTKVEASEVTIDATGGGTFFPQAFGFRFGDDDYFHVIEDVSGTNGDTIKLDDFRATTQGNGLLYLQGKHYDETVVTVTGGGSWSTDFVDLMPYRDPYSGAWYLQGNISGSSASQSSIDINIAGILFPNTTYPLAGTLAVESGAATLECYTSPNTNTFKLRSNSSRTYWSCEFDLPIQGKPTWADDIPLQTLSKGAAVQNQRARFYDSKTASVTASNPIPFDTVSPLMAANGVNNTNGTMSVDYAGTYEIRSLLARNTGTWGAGGGGRMDLYKNGARVTPMGAMEGTDIVMGEATVDLLPTDTFSVRMSATYTTLGGDLSTFVEVKRQADDTGQGLVGAGVITSDSPGDAVGLFGNPESQQITRNTNGHGGSSSGETSIRNFLTHITDIGGAFTYVPRTSSTADYWIVNRDCLAAYNFTDGRSAGGFTFCVSVNAKGTSDPNGTGSDQTSTNPSLLDYDKRLGFTDTETANQYGSATGVHLFKKDDRIRCHGNGQGNLSCSMNIYEIVRLG